MSRGGTLRDPFLVRLSLGGGLDYQVSPAFDRVGVREHMMIAS